jgi:TetR/AcrR family transcriptional repressor of nem operon
MAREKNFCEETMLDKLTEVFWQNGYNGTSMDHLLQQASLSRSSMYATYGDKRNLYLQALKKYVVKQDSYITEWMKKCNSTTDAVNKLFSFVIDANLQCSIAKGCFLVNTIVEWSTTDVDINTIVQGHRVAFMQGFEKLIKADQRNGIIAKDAKPTALALFIFNNFNGIQVAIKSGSNKEELIQVKKMVIKFLLKI